MSKNNCKTCSKELVATQKRKDPKYCNSACYKKFLRNNVSVKEPDYEDYDKALNKREKLLKSMLYALIVNSALIVIILCLSINTTMIIKDQKIERTYHINMNEILD